MIRKIRILVLLLVLSGLGSPAFSQAKSESKTVKDPFADIYKGYRPSFMPEWDEIKKRHGYSKAHKDKKVKEQIRKLKEVIADTVPENDDGPFKPFSRITFNRYGVPFELRFWPRSVGMVYDKAAVNRALAGRTGPNDLFARAELAMAESDLKTAN